MSRVVFTPIAERKLRSILRWFRLRNPSADIEIVRDLRLFCGNLDHMPYRFPLREQYGPGIRLGLVGRCVVL